MEGASVEDPAAFGARLRRVMEKALRFLRTSVYFSRCFSRSLNMRM
jgi:hypothetical protein